MIRSTIAHILKRADLRNHEYQFIGVNCTFEILKHPALVFYDGGSGFCDGVTFVGKNGIQVNDSLVEVEGYYSLIKFKDGDFVMCRTDKDVINHYWNG